MTALYRLRNPSAKISLILNSIVKGMSEEGAARTFNPSGDPPHLQSNTIRRWIARTAKHSQALPAILFTRLSLPILQLDELRAILRVPNTLFNLAPRINPDIDIAPLFLTDGLQAYFYAITTHFGAGLPTAANEPMPAPPAFFFKSNPDLLYAQACPEQGRIAFANCRPTIHPVIICRQPRDWQVGGGGGWLRLAIANRCAIRANHLNVNRLFCFRNGIAQDIENGTSESCLSDVERVEERVETNVR